MTILFTSDGQSPLPLEIDHDLVDRLVIDLVREHLGVKVRH